MKKMKKIIFLTFCLVLPLIVGALSSYFTSPNIPTWYASLHKPSFNPPNDIFAPVWTILYLAMGISFYLAFTNAEKSNKSRIVYSFTFQLILNSIWSFLFFQFHWIGIAMIEILLLWLSIFAMIITFYKSNRIAAYANIPYLTWVSFAAILNYFIFILN